MADSINTIESEIKFSSIKAKDLRNNFNFLMRDIDQRAPIFYSLARKYDFSGEILELGAGSCWFSSLISKNSKVKKVYALDISEDLLKIIGNQVIDQLKGQRDKIKFITANFHKLPFENKKIDIIICDASLHHAQDLALVLKEVNRVLKDDGFLVAIREPIKSFLHKFYLRDFGKKEKESGSIENIYGREQWKKYFSEAGLDLSFVEDFSQRNKKTELLKRTPLKFLNGMLFSRYYFFARKRIIK